MSRYSVIDLDYGHQLGDIFKTLEEAKLEAYRMWFEDWIDVAEHMADDYRDFFKKSHSGLKKMKKMASKVEKDGVKDYKIIKKLHDFVVNLDLEDLEFESKLLNYGGSYSGKRVYRNIEFTPISQLYEIWKVTTIKL